MTMSIYTVIGLVGAAVFIGSYLLLALGRISSGTPFYYGLNLLGIGMALVSHLQALNLSSAIIQSFVLMISVVGLVRWRRNCRLRRHGKTE